MAPLQGEKNGTARCWRLLVRRECGADTSSHFVLTNAHEMVAAAPRHGSRYFIEHDFREAKSELAMADCHARRWDACHRYLVLVMNAILFLLGERLVLQEAAPLLSLGDLVPTMGMLQRTPV